MSDGKRKARYICTVDAIRATKDYLRGGRCVRLIGIEPHEYSARSLEGGVSTFTIDVDYWEFCRKYFSLKFPFQDARRWHEARLESFERDEDGIQTWFQVEVAFTSQERAYSYLYRNFSEEPEKYFKLKSVDRLPSPHFSIPRSPRNVLKLIPNPANGSAYRFEAFHVGQGMCSLVHNGQTGFLLDAGAGKPIVKPSYNTLPINRLAQLLRGLSTVYCVVSHPDSDHWRLLSWDRSLLAVVCEIWIPSGIGALAFRDRALRSKLVGVGDSVVQLDTASSLALFRSKPAKSDRNGECLVVEFVKNGDRVLAPGDYVYSRMVVDRNPSIKNLSRGRYAGVVVPHHGDAHSAQGIFPPNGRAKAFFSAGTNQSYGHPTPASLVGHATIGYMNVNKHTQAIITEETLL